MERQHLVGAGVGSQRQRFGNFSRFRRHLYVGGNFTTAGGATANRVARWDGAAWHSLGNGTTNGVGGTVSAILPVSPTEVYVGGTFTTAGVVAANRIARFDGTSWSALGSGMSGVTLPRP